MPVEINELVIRATIASPESPQQATVVLTDDAQKIQQLLDEVMKKLADQDER